MLSEFENQSDVFKIISTGKYGFTMMNFNNIISHQYQFTILQFKVVSIQLSLKDGNTEMVYSAPKLPSKNSIDIHFAQIPQDDPGWQD